MHKTHSAENVISICKKRIYPWNEHLIFQGSMDGEILKSPPRGKKSPATSPLKKKTKTIKDIKRSPRKNKAPKRKRNAREVLVVAQAFKNHRLWECLQKLKVIDAPDQVSKLEEFIKNAQGAALSRGMDIQPAVAALSRETAVVEEERRLLEEERKGLEAAKADYFKKLEKYEEWKLLFEKERDLLTEMKEAQKKNAEADTRLRQCKRLINNCTAQNEAAKKNYDDFFNSPCLYCEEKIRSRHSYRVCGKCQSAVQSFYVDSAEQTAEVDSD